MYILQLTFISLGATSFEKVELQFKHLNFFLFSEYDINYRNNG